MYKRHKVVVTFNKCHLGRSSDIHVSLIQNSLGAMNRGTESHLSLISDDTMFKNFNLQVLIPFNKTCFARACTNFSSFGLICQSWVQSLSEFVEVTICPVTVLSFK